MNLELSQKEADDLLACISVAMGSDLIDKSTKERIGDNMLFRVSDIALASVNGGKIPDKLEKRY